MVTPQDWLKQLDETMPIFLASLQVPGHKGHYYSCKEGRTRLGSQVRLGFSCFALKLQGMLGLWPQLPPAEQAAWIAYIQSFQRLDSDTQPGAFSRHAFWDAAVVDEAYQYHRYPVQFAYWLYGYARNPRRFVYDIIYRESLSRRQRALLAETKQAIATLAEVGASSLVPYRDFPATSTAVTEHLAHLDWKQPWGAGAQSAIVALLLTVEGPRFMETSTRQECLTTMAHFFENLVDAETGAYFQGSAPAYGQLVNGAMKVLTALDWLAIPAHYPEQLIDTCLACLPRPDGCHLVDAVYVLYQCSQQTSYRRADIQAYSRQVLKMVQKHYNEDGGLSYYIGRSQTGYYGVRIARGLPVSDIHGSLLLTWAVVMLAELLELNTFGWQVLKP